MRSTRWLSTIVVLLGTLAATNVPAQDGPIQGAWAVVSAEQDGKPTTDVAKHRLTFSGDTFTIQRDDRTLYRGTYSVDAGKQPAWIDFRHTGADLAGKTWKGIYRLEGGKLTICDNAPAMAKPRPTRFATGAGYICIVFTRATG